MPKSLRYLSISHKTASVAQREQFYISEEEKHRVVEHFCDVFPDISAMLLLVTCNRTEVYFESENTTSSMLLRELASLKGIKDFTKIKDLFDCKDCTKAAVKHLLKVSSGMESKVLGDAEIIHQIKKAYLFSTEHELQGSLLERAMQTVFRTHKRISNETSYRDGTTSLAYKSLKVIRKSYDKTTARTKKILIIGAGDIVVQLFKYNSKFNFNNIYISNRTEEKANRLAVLHQCNLYPWQKVLKNDFEDFDVIISAVGNSPRLIRNIQGVPKKRMLIDLGLPSNIDKALEQDEKLSCYDLDSISVDLEENKKKRIAAVDKVKELLELEMDAYIQWLEMASLRSALAKHKEVIFKKVEAYLKKEVGSNDLEATQFLTNQIIKKMFLHPDSTDFSSEEIDALIAKQASLHMKASF